MKTGYKQTIHKYEIGIISNIPASKIKLIADKLQTTPAYLMGWHTSPEVTTNDVITDIIFRLRSDNDFFDITKAIMNLSPEKLDAVKSMLTVIK